MKDYLQLTKPRITLMVAATAIIGFWLAGGRSPERLFWMVLGVALASASTGTLNQYLESDRDALMRRTSRRPLPSGRMSPERAVAFGAACAAAGVGLLAWKINMLAAGLTLSTLFSYLLLYTPLKARTPQCVWIGSAAGAMPPLIGWAGAAGILGPKAWALFAIQFLWQIPHFMALFWLYREEYARAGFRVMPVLDPGGRTTAVQIAIHSLTLMLASLLPVFCGLGGAHYCIGALVLGSVFLGFGMRASWTLASPDTKRLFWASLAYLPALFGMLVFAGA